MSMWLEIRNIISPSPATLELLCFRHRMIISTYSSSVHCSSFQLTTLREAETGWRLCSEVKIMEDMHPYLVTMVLTVQ